MSDAKEKAEGPERMAETPALKSLDAQEARSAGASDLASVEKVRTNASDGSLRRYSAEHLASQEESIELVYGDQSTSRIDKKSERELLREKANKPENINTHALESLAKDTSLPEDRRALASMIQELRAQSKAHGTSTETIDGYAQEALRNELLAKSQKQLKQNDDLEDCGSHYYQPGKSGISVGSKAYTADQLLSQENLQGQVLSDAHARASDAIDERTLLHGSVSEPDIWDKVARLPEQTQAEVILTAIKAHTEHWGREQTERQIGSLIGTTEGVGTILQDVATITDFSAACIKGDQETASKMGAEFGESMGRTLVGGVNVLKISDRYLGDLGASGDWTKPASDLAQLGSLLDKRWSELPPREQERLKYRFVTEFAATSLMPGAATRVFKAAKFTEVLPNMAKVAAKAGAELNELPGDVKKTVNGIRDLCQDLYSKEAVTPEGGIIKFRPSEVKPGEDHVFMMKGEPRDFIKNLDGLDRIDELRLKHSVGRNQNIAYAEVKITGQEGDLVGISGVVSPSGTVKTPKEWKFKTQPKGAATSEYDSESKILEHIAEGLEKGAEGSITIYTERKPCFSCRDVIYEFRKEYPGITLKVEYGKNR
jgi:hypothetical protein